ncbi:MAG: lysoplasmalogenase [Actinomycetia bacterium]|nr:lysoplasmalogenase [Actinomycetes bacterium]
MALDPVALWSYAALAAVDLIGVATQTKSLRRLAKPLLAPALAVGVARATGRPRGAMVAGLACAAGGDTALLFPGRPAFLTGMGSFLGAQLCYRKAFRQLDGAPDWPTNAPPIAGAPSRALPRRSQQRGVELRAAAPYALTWLAANAALARRLGPLAVPVAGYSAALLAMAHAARRLGPGGQLGGALFVLSDLMIGIGKAGADFPGRELLTMSSYIAAQALLAENYARRAPRAA